jgi:predicted GTPase
MQKDDITIQISNILKEFLNFFNNELQKKVLEIGKDAVSESFYQQLKRVSNSLEQYIRKEIGLFYVGFLGSYSSGKSSTINSLLSLWGTELQRNTSMNPTDDYITLITNPENVNNVFTFAKEGALSVRTQTNIESTFLENIVLMDTPGSGDPHIIESIVRDSLPLCDLIIYILNATAPFTIIDKPFLIAQQGNLKSIPLIFVLTRGDEFAITKSEKVSKSNFNYAQYDVELENIVNRINSSLNISDFKKDDFIIIDNMDNYNIDLLTKKIKDKTENNNESLVYLHNHKLNYFKKEINEIHNYYLSLTEKKIDKCERFFEKAKNNIEYFEEQIEYSKGKFRTLWNEYSNNINKIYEGTVLSYLDSSLKSLEILVPFYRSSNFLLFKERIVNDLRKEAGEKSNEIIKEIEEKSYEAIFNLKQLIQDNISYELSNIKNIDIINYENVKFDMQYPFEIYQFVNNCIGNYKNHTRSIIGDIINLSNQINKSLKVETPIDTINQNIYDYKIAIRDILEIYYKAISMYNTAVISYEVKSYINELCLADKFDELESIGIDKEKYNLIAEKELLQGYDKISENYRHEIMNIFNESELLKKELNIPLNIEEKKVKDIDLKSLSIEENKSFNNVNEFVKNSYNDLKINTFNELSRFEDEIKLLKKIRFKKYLSVCTFAFLIAVLFYIVINMSKDIQLSNSLLSGIILGISTSVIASIIIRLFDKYRFKKNIIINKYKDIIFKTNLEIINKVYKEFKEKNEIMKNEIKNEIFYRWENTLEQMLTKISKLIFEKEEMKISEMKLKLKLLIENYKSVYTKHHKSLLEFFNNYENNIAKIDDITIKIKEDSIKPSFDLLAETLKEIRSVKKEIEILKIQ